MEELLAYVNGQFLPAGEASVPVSDLAVQRGYGIFDFLKTVNHRPIFLSDHLDRFFYSADQLRLAVGTSRCELTQVLKELMDRNALGDSGIRITLTGGAARDGYTITKPSLIITQQQLTPGPQPAPTGIRLMTHEHLRQFPTVKTIDYLMAIWLQPILKERGVDDVLYCHDGVASECPRANFFIVTRDGELATPDEGVLKGITRKHLLLLAGEKLKARQRPVAVEEIYGAKEAFITSTTRNIQPVSEVDGRAIGDGQVGEVTRWLSELLAQRIRQEQERSI
jgi:D-alanine transaminase/branched-chain amino acid aminotransferase